MGGSLQTTQFLTGKNCEHCISFGSDELDCFRTCDRPRILNVAGIDGTGGLEQQNVHFRIGVRPVLGSVRHDDELALRDQKCLFDARGVAVSHVEFALQDEEHFVFPFVTMPNEVSLELDDFDVLTIELPYDLRTPMFVECGELLFETNLFHRATVLQIDDSAKCEN
jgi:hypothetical protein